MMKLISFIKASLLLGGMLTLCTANAQELYVFTEPASNMPARSVSVKVSGKFAEERNPYKFMQRYTPELMFGLSNKWMLHVAPTFSNIYSANQRWESAKVYAKYRFFSNDDVHKHFRMAVFGEGSYARNTSVFDELSVQGDNSGAEGGLILTQLVNKLAVSSTVSYLNTTRGKSADVMMNIPDQAFNYTLSAGYLILPVNYTSFNQTNLNVYAELLGQRGLDMKKYMLDFAPAVQLIFNSNAKLNIGYRFQLAGNMNRMSENSWLISFERTFLKVW